MRRQTPPNPHASRRRFLAATSTIGLASVAGCLDLLQDSDNEPPGPTIGQIGSGRQGRDPPGGTPMAEMPALEGSLTVYSGRGEFLVGPLIEYINNLYDDFSLTPRYGGSTDLVNQIVNEGSGSSADVFYSVNAGALGALAAEDRTTPLPDDILSLVRDEFHTDTWIGTSGRARTVPYNTNEFTESDMPNDIMAYPSEFAGSLGWAPSYGSCQAFVTAMRILEGEQRTREWLEAIVASDIRDYPDEFATCLGIADGEIDAGFTNHYYIQRVLDGDSSAPIATAFTNGDAGAMFNVAGAAVVDTTNNRMTAENFVRHLLSAEAQDYFARATFEYPLIPDVDPIGDLPSIEDLDVPDIDLTQLSDLRPTIDLMRDAGVNV